MAVIDEFIIIENGESKSVDSAENKPIDLIQYENVDYHFAKANEVNDGVCINSVNEPIIDMHISGNTVQSLLPNEYQQVEYIESTGTQYLVIDYIASGITSSKGKYQITDITKSGFLFGCRGTAGTSFYGLNWGGGLPYKYYNAYMGANLTDVQIDNNIHEFHKNKGNLYLDGELIKSIPEQVFTTPKKMNILACDDNGRSGYLPPYAKFFYLQFYDEETLMVDLIPCYRKSDNEIGMYDLVNGVFYTNLGTGTFLKGSDAPTPEAPIEIESVGDKTKNLLDISSAIGKESILNDAKVWIGEDGSINGSGIPTGFLAVTERIAPKLSGTVTFSMQGNYSNISCLTRLFDANNTILYEFNLTENNKTQTIDIDNDYPTYNQIYLEMKRDYNNIEMSGKAYLQLEQGSIATEYEPYGYKIPIKINDIITNNIYIKEPLRKIGNYADYVDYKNKKVVRTTKQTELTGDESFTLLGVGTSSARVYTVLSDKESTLNLGLCSHFKKVKSVDDTPTSCDFIGAFFRVNVSELNISTVSEWNEYLKNKYDNGTPIEFVYLLATPTEETIDIPEILTFDGTTMFDIETKIKPSESKINYWQQI